MRCIFNETLISRGLESHVCQFAETREGERYPIFTDEKAVIVIDENEHYQVATIDDWCVFVGDGYDEAIRRINFAQPNVELSIYYNGKQYTKDEYERKKEREANEANQVEM